MGVTEKSLQATANGEGKLGYTSALSEKVIALYRVHGEIIEAEQNSNRGASVHILKQRANLEREINQYLAKGEQINDRILDYSIRNFVENVSGKTAEATRPIDATVFDIVPRISEFVRYIDKKIGSKILSTYDNMPAEVGIISGSVDFRAVDNSRYMYIPAEPLRVLENGRWSSAEFGEGIVVNPKIFLNPETADIPLKKDSTWEEYHYNEKHLAETKLNGYQLHIGNGVVGEQLEGDLEIIIRAHMPIPNPNLD